MSEIVYEICHIAVNCYVMITGYFMITKPFKLNRLTVLWVEVLFYAVGLYVVLCCMGLQAFQIKELINAVFPITFKEYWFMTNYMGLLIFAPVLNVFVNHVSKSKYLLTLIGLGGISLTLLVKFPLGDTFGGSYGLLWFIFLYLVTCPCKAIGRYFGDCQMATLCHLFASLMSCKDVVACSSVELKPIKGQGTF